MLFDVVDDDDDDDVVVVVVVVEVDDDDDDDFDDDDGDDGDDGAMDHGQQTATWNFRKTLPGITTHISLFTLNPKAEQYPQKCSPTRTSFPPTKKKIKQSTTNVIACFQRWFLLEGQGWFGKLKQCQLSVCFVPGPIQKRKISSAS